MARNISLAVGRHVPFSFPKFLGNESTTTLSIYRGSITLRDVLRGIGETVSLIAAAGRVGAAVHAGRKPDASDLKTAGLDGVEFSRPHYRY